MARKNRCGRFQDPIGKETRYVLAQPVPDVQLEESLLRHIADGGYPL